MEKMIRYESLRNFAYSNDKICQLPIRGIVVSFLGLRASDRIDGETEEGRFYAGRGLLFVIPYSNPWSWMNRRELSYSNEILDVLRERYQLPEDIPVVATGGSMGGQSALTYMIYAERTPVACVAICPPCDLLYHFTERADLPRTFYNAYYHETGTLEDAIRAASPLELVDRFPDADYVVFHCEKDTQVNKERHSDRFVAAMQKNHRIRYYSVPDRGHCDLTEEMRDLSRTCIVEAVLSHSKAGDST